MPTTFHFDPQLDDVLESLRLHMAPAPKRIFFEKPWPCWMLPDGARTTTAT